jgi:hypothetical protein
MTSTQTETSKGENLVKVYVNETAPLLANNLVVTVCEATGEPTIVNSTDVEYFYMLTGKPFEVFPDCCMSYIEVPESLARSTFVQDNDDLDCDLDEVGWED